MSCEGTQHQCHIIKREFNSTYPWSVHTHTVHKVNAVFTFPKIHYHHFLFEAPLPQKLCLLQPIRTQHKINGEYGRVVHFFSLLACIISGVNNFTGRCKEKTNCCGLRTLCIGLRRKLQFEYNYLCGFIFLPIFS